MAIAKGPDWIIRSFYIDYSFEEVMFHWNHIEQKAYRKFYDDTKESHVVTDNHLFNDGLLYGEEITREEYESEKKGDIKKRNTINPESLAIELFDKALYLAYEAHKNQLDKAGMPYILHPLRVMFTFNTLELKTIAILHDVIEDSKITLKELKKEGFNPKILDALSALTKIKEETYDNFIERILSNELATLVKIADIEDNLNITRLNILTETDLIRIKKYHDNLKILKNSIKNSITN